MFKVLEALLCSPKEINQILKNFLEEKSAHLYSTRFQRSNSVINCPNFDKIWK